MPKNKTASLQFADKIKVTAKSSTSRSKTSLNLHETKEKSLLEQLPHELLIRILLNLLSVVPEPDVVNSEEDELAPDVADDDASDVSDDESDVIDAPVSNVIAANQPTPVTDAAIVASYNDVIEIMDKRVISKYFKGMMLDNQLWHEIFKKRFPQAYQALTASPVLEKAQTNETEVTASQNEEATQTEKSESTKSQTSDEAQPEKESINWHKQYKIEYKRCISASLIHAIQNGDLNVIEQLVKNHSDLVEGDEGGRILREVILMGSEIEWKLPCIQAILEANPALLNQPYFGFTPLMLACHLPSYELAKFFLIAGAHVNVTTNVDNTFPKTAMYYAVTENTLYDNIVDAVRLGHIALNLDKLRACIDIDKDKTIAQLLMEWGGDIERTYNGQSVLHILAARQSSILFRYDGFIEKLATKYPGALEILDADKNTPLAYALLTAVRGGDTAFVALKLLKVGGNPHVRAHTNDGEIDILYLFAQYGDKDVVRNLIEKGVSVRAAMDTGQQIKRNHPTKNLYAEKMIKKQKKLVEKDEQQARNRKVGQAVRNTAMILTAVNNNNYVDHLSKKYKKPKNMPSKEAAIGAITKLHTTLTKRHAGLCLFRFSNEEEGIINAFPKLRKALTRAQQS